MEKIQKISCSFCHKEIECPEDMLNAERHSCYECFQKNHENWPKEWMGKIHIDMPMEEMDNMMPEALVNLLIETTFQDVWKKEKENLKELSKKELAEEMFGKGAWQMIHLVMEMQKHPEKFEELINDKEEKD